MSNRFSLVRRRVLAGAILAATCGIAVPALAAQPVTVALTHAKGTTEVPAAPKRVVVYDLGALDTLQALGVPVAGGPKAQMPGYLQDYASRYAVAGSLFEPDYEALSSIKPDLIIVGGRSSAKLEILGRIAPTLDMSIDGRQMLNDIKRNVNTLAGLFGKQAQGKALIERMDREVADLRRLAGQAEPGVLLMAINEKIIPQVPGSRFGFLFDVLGAKSAVGSADLPPQGTAYTFDDLAKLNPQWIYVIDRNTATGQAAGGGDIIPSQKVFDNAQVKGTAAGQKGQVVFLDPKGWYLMGGAGPSALLGNVAQLRQAYNAAGLR
ncbi:siderophore ABC transporter substrate-binding protein [Thauera sp. Sel9]|uniref:siderophore ABC transporter substrate-binding protein n=1 Tax=Thauera sp. Sel9 TaxID=2974299 RepID=UPI0021E15BB7|nr:siderophore ABC transporter substrate-binding protein [Thauera sp. Sel9]MCV2219510.1 siderophore ABC transporter substrate-binding protein [Thauera sp. Sel9]